MRGWILALLIGVATVLGACGGPGTQSAADQAATTVASTDLQGGLNEAGTAVADTDPQALNEVGTAVNAPEVGTAVSEAADELRAVADDVMLNQGEQLLLDASQSVGDIKDFKWTIQQAPLGAESVQGMAIKEGSSGMLSLNPDDYAKYFPVAGTYTVRLTIADASGKTSYDDFQVEVP